LLPVRPFVSIVDAPPREVRDSCGGFTRVALEAVADAEKVTEINNDAIKVFMSVS